MVVQDKRSGGAVAAAACGVSLAVGLAVGALATGCSPSGAVAEDQRAARQASVDRAPAPSAVPGSSAVRDVRGSADALVRAGSSRVRTAMETASGGTRVAIRGAGAYDYRTTTGRLGVVLPDPAGAGSGGHRPITEILTPGALYMKNRGAGVPPDKWVRVDTGTLADGNLVTGGATDPLAAAELLRGAREVTYEGRERLDGVPVRHYRGSTDIGAAARAASPGTRSALAAAEKGFTTDVVPFDAYLDDAGRLRKVRQRFRFANGSSQGTLVTSTTTLYDFGTPVAVGLPDDRDIYTGKIASGGG
ncbi:hypothetical protein [Streptomyces sp. MST-110588]|uniref:hypothetical protein n=1 Tax=Streptomyces sp. MST-110588 TaxID=2833628 RepID=UPI001F5C3738|nr:hypothetical protein [Streptomyces sp. MST-110588]UNO40551.1 hypothetical protein KGS77_14405 [Streptomyces sp. MST-110588]